MGLLDKIVKSMANGGIERVLVIDDAFDPPLLDAELAAELALFLEGEAAAEIAREEQFDVAELSGSLVADEFDDDGLERFVRSTYGRYVLTNDARWDVGGRFNILKSVTLDVLRPLLQVLRTCEGIRVETAGHADAEQSFEDLQPNLVFLDFFLAAPGAIGDDDIRDRNASIDLLTRLTSQEPGKVPSVVLMSSKANQDRSHEFRRDTDLRHAHDQPKVLSWRFHFLDKKLIKGDGQAIELAPDAVDALLDASQSYRFGTELHRALEQWRLGARSAVDDLTRSIGELDIKDFAYLTRFRLREEGIPLSEYLQWLFGENLLDQVGRTVDWSHDSFAKLDGDPDGLIAPIEGAYEGPTSKIASMFAKARITDATQRRRSTDLRMGDLFRISGTDGVRAVLTPDCDLVIRNGRRAVPHVLTVAGKLHSYDTPNNQLTDFLVDGSGKPCSISWRRKELETIDFAADPLRSHAGELEYIGSLRPMYALDLQRSVLNDVARIGLAVAPVIGMSASAKLLLKDTGGTAEKDVKFGTKAICTVMPPRGGVDLQARTLFYRSAVHKIVTFVRTLRPEDVAKADRAHVHKIHQDAGEEMLYRKLCIEGVRLDVDTVLGIGFATKKIKGNDSPWLQIIVQMLDDEVWSAAPDAEAVDPGERVVQEEFAQVAETETGTEAELVAQDTGDAAMASAK